MTEHKNIYVTLGGIEVPIKPISPTKVMRAELGVEKAFRDRGEPIDPPTYDVETAGGGVETFEMDATAVEIPGDEEETKKRQIVWMAHTEAVLKLKREQFDITRKIVIEAIDLPLPKDESWVEEQKELYIDVPDDPHARWLHWLETEVLNPQDIIEIITSILSLSAQGILPEEDIKAATALFRSSIYSQAQRPGEQEDTPEPDAEEEGEVVAQPDNAGSGDSEGVEDEPESV